MQDVSAKGETRLSWGGKRVFLGVPGTSFDFGCIQGLLSGSKCHDVRVHNSGRGAWFDFDFIWAAALNQAEQGLYTHFAMLHSDVAPAPLWIDTLLTELDTRQADMVSAVVPIKDARGLTSCGIGDPDDQWAPLRRFTMREIHDLPVTFDAADAGYPGGILLHNTGCWVCDLRKPLFYETDDEGYLKCHFPFPKRVKRDARGEWVSVFESEDWFFSRQMHDLGAKTFVTRAVELTHRGPNDYPNALAWGSYADGDDDLRHKWDKSARDSGRGAELIPS